MEIRNRAGIDLATVKSAVATASEQYDGNLITVDMDQMRPGMVRGRVGVKSSREAGARTSWSGRRGPWACWHAYRDAIRAIFAVYPEAVIVTSLARYNGAEGFEATYPATAYKNVGSIMCPAYMPELCQCH
jgi:hypothetical protein